MNSRNLKFLSLALILCLVLSASYAAAEDMLDEATRNMALDDMASALAAKERGDLSGAIKRFTYALTHGNLDDENRAIAYNNRGNCYADIGEKEKAMLDYNLAVTIDPNFTEAYFNRAGLLYTNGRYQEALNDYQKAVDLNPGLAQVHYNMSFAFAKLKRYDEAIKAVQEALVLSPGNKKYLEQLAIWRGMAGQK